MMRSGYVYYVRSKSNGRIYVGSTMRSTAQRWNEHLHALRHNKHHCSKLQNSYNKHGEADLVFESVEFVDDVVFLLAREQFHMWRHPGNLMNGIDISDSIYAAHAANRGRVMGDDERQRRSDAVKAANVGVDHYAKYTPEVRAKMSVRRKLRIMGACSDQTKAKIGIANSRPKTPEHVAAMVASRTAFIQEELPQWLAMLDQGMSYRDIEKVTGRSRKMLSRECNKAKA